ncbi:MAG: HDOD domain-containing protein [Gammaproteobacteria bacterium]|nr:HDOD domain-containing protein [Rhodocyclaceae bacterium]MBU3910248.1 HDOD domain-containing protein [Gammaproteobacteria bacterium]MBU3989443.1 HDOD domain-containing protein [Gammaproteobacteria bacterium]MBU4005418.1 HDOD domain-containing protein [Gammaproteobacteria bacterium]MBU4022710.1 HDOD domain-containing protein [Gammaproteobacteria bacterium]
MDPRIFELEICPDGSAASGYGVLAVFVPAAENPPPVVLMGCDPRHDPGRPISELAAAAIGWIVAQLGTVAGDVCWVVIDNYGRFNQAVPDFTTVGVTAGDSRGTGGAAAVPVVEFKRFASGISIDAFYRDIGAAGEAAIELLSAVIEQPSQDETTPSMREFLDAVEAHGSLPAPGMIFRKVATAAEEGDARQVANAIQPDPVISASLINSANAARFANAGKTASVPQAVTRLGTSFVRRVVFIAEMMARYQKGACASFDYRGYWLNAIATGAAMRALLDDYEIPARLADDAFTTGLLSGIGWLVVAETHPALMARYLERCKDADPITKARAQREIFPCEICKVSERYLQRFEFPDAIQATVAGRSDVDRKWFDILARAMRVSQGISPFNCLAIPTTIPVPDACREEWQRWQSFLAAGN